MTQYTLSPSSFSASQVGTVYNIGLSDGTNSYGYIFQNQGQQTVGIKESSNVADKEKLIQFSSPNLIDRDLVFYPRVTQGDFSGGGLQTVFLDPTKYFDSDLEIRTPGFLNLRPAWKRTQLATGLGAVTPQSVPWKNDIYTTFQGSVVYNSAGTSTATGNTALYLATDGWNLYAGDGNASIRYTNDGSTWSDLSTASGAYTQMWSVLQGTAGRFFYMARVIAGSGATVFHNLYKLDTGATLPNNSPVLVPTGNVPLTIVDVVPYQSGIAVLTKDPQGSGSDVWFHDGSNMTRIVRLEQYAVVGMVNCLGSLYVTATSFGQSEAPVLIRIDAGSFQIVARPASPQVTTSAASVGAPAASGQYVYFTLVSPQINQITTTSYIGVYDTVSAAFSHIGSLDSLDSPLASSVRQLTAAGRAAAFPMISSGTGYLQYQTDNTLLASGDTYAASGTLISSRIDFGTPGIPKRFRRVEAVHAPLATGESVNLKVYVDGDQFHVGATPLTAQTTNASLNSTITSCVMGADTVGRTMYYSVTLAGPGTSTPDVIRIATEIGGTWTWEFDLDCTSRRRTLQQQLDDSQGANGKDLYYLLRNAYENGTTLTLYLASSANYAATIESLEGHSPAYSDHPNSTVRADQEWLVHVILKQVA